MLTEVKNNYKSILRHFNFDESLSSADYKKQKLIEMANNGEPRPTQKTKEGRLLSNYTVKSSSSYCSNFDRTVRKLRPDWFVLQTQIAEQVRQKLIKMAKNGETRPNRKTKIGRQLSAYTAESSKLYRPEFDKLIRKLSPDWFYLSAYNKQKLIEMARNKNPKPKFGTKEQQALINYTNKKCGAYCPEFDKTIRKIAPNWFLSTSKIMKDKLIQMANKKEDRPRRKTKEGQALSDYTNKSSKTYCKKFDKTIRKLSPDWFVSQTQIADQLREKLMAIAKSDKPRPSCKTKEGQALYNYIRRSPNFDKTIRKLRPDWFVKCSPK